MVDLFDEVEEQLRSDRYRTLALRALPWVIGIAALALAAALGWWFWQERQTRLGAEASDKYAAAMESYAKRDGTRAFGQFEEVANSGPPVYRAMALMQQAGIRLEDNKVDEAVRLFDASAEVAPDPLLEDLARLKSALALLDTAPYAELENRLEPLTEEERPYRIEAREALAFAKLMAGKTSEARGDFAVLSLSPDSTDAIRSRARAAMEMIDSGSAKALPAAVKAAAALPAPQVPQPQGPVQAQPGAAQ
ncbi:MAG TPA: tetratricopeptide repeat protein [Caulobacteraceae bacterium]|nr:tetratricopeptide repeat protein [Caulobacteraceae bacterium]